HRAIEISVGAGEQSGFGVVVHQVHLPLRVEGPLGHGAIEVYCQCPGSHTVVNVQNVHTAAGVKSAEGAEVGHVDGQGRVDVDGLSRRVDTVEIDRPPDHVEGDRFVDVDDIVERKLTTPGELGIVAAVNRVESDHAMQVEIGARGNIDVGIGIEIDFGSDSGHFGPGDAKFGVPCPAIIADV